MRYYTQSQGCVLYCHIILSFQVSTSATNTHRYSSIISLKCLCVNIPMVMLCIVTLYHHFRWAYQPQTHWHWTAMGRAAQLSSSVSDIFFTHFYGIVTWRYCSRGAHLTQHTCIYALLVQRHHDSEQQTCDGSPAEATGHLYTRAAQWEGCRGHQLSGSEAEWGGHAAWDTLLWSAAARRWRGCWGEQENRVSTYLQGTVEPF